MPTIIPHETITIAEAVELSQRRDLELSAEARSRIARCRSYLEEKLKAGNGVYYGINTGFGALEKVRISNDKIEELQLNLVRSHACGTGAPVRDEIIRLMLLLKVIGLARGHSGVRVELVEGLVGFLNHDIHPVVYEQGSLGASGDLAPLAHLSLPLIGEGQVYANGAASKAGDVLAQAGLKPLRLKAKEGLALLNGTQFMTAFGCAIAHGAGSILIKADLVAASSLDAYSCRLEPFQDVIHLLRPHDGQMAVAEHILSLLGGSELATQPKQQTQDPYSFRCIPQVHGASRDAIVHAMMVIETELNAVTDNPLIFSDEDKIVSGGNFHGQPVALVLDYLAIALAELGSISERRTFLLLSGQRGLPDFLAGDPGLQSGLMILQYTAAALVAENRLHCTPSSVDNVITSQGQEDHVSMGAHAAIKCMKVLDNLKRILAIESLCATRALELRQPARTSPVVSEWCSSVMSLAGRMQGDRQWHDAIAAVAGELL
jgi:histidine ammonia-lyase